MVDQKESQWEKHFYTQTRGVAVEDVREEGVLSFKVQETRLLKGFKFMILGLSSAVRKSTS